jgi:hypothetical protein
MNRSPRPLRSRRIAYIGAVLVIGLTACGAPTDDAAPAASAPAGSSAPPVPQVIQVAGAPSAGVAAAPAAESSADASASDSTKMMAGPMVYVYDGEPVDLTSPAASWFFDPTVQPTAGQIAALAATLGVAGDTQELPADQGGGWLVGPDDYSAPTVNVSGDAMQSWWFSPGATLATSSADCELYPPGDPAGDPQSSVADLPMCTPAPPEGLPDAAGAEDLAKALFDSIGLDSGSYEFETYADEWSSSVTGYLVLDGIRTSVAVSVGFGEEGKVTWASGYLAAPQRGPDYARIGIDAAIERLNEQSASWMNVDTSVVRDSGSGVASDQAATTDIAPDVAPDVAPDGTAAPAVMPAKPALPGAVVDPIEGVCLDDTGGECTPTSPIDVEPITVTLHDAAPSLEQLWATDDTVWLLPGYAFSTTDGAMFSVMAVEDQYIQVVQPAADLPVPIEEPVPADAPACPPVPTEITDPGLSTQIGDQIVGLCQADAEALVAREYPDATVRVVRIDGLDQVVTDDLRNDRVNVAVENGIVTEVVSIG